MAQCYDCTTGTAICTWPTNDVISF